MCNTAVAVQLLIIST